jgi:hypothetical protein
MTKQHFEFVASLINAAFNGVAPQHLATLAAAKFAQDNPRFDKDKFLSACGFCADGTPKPERVFGLDNHSLVKVTEADVDAQCQALAKRMASL